MLEYTHKHYKQHNIHTSNKLDRVNKTQLHDPKWHQRETRVLSGAPRSGHWVTNPPLTGGQAYIQHLLRKERLNEPRLDPTSSATSEVVRLSSAMRWGRSATCTGVHILHYIPASCCRATLIACPKNPATTSENNQPPLCERACWNTMENQGRGVKMRMLL